MYNKSIVAMIRRILETKDDMEFLPMLSEIAINEIERLALELDYERNSRKPYGN